MAYIYTRMYNGLHPQVPDHLDLPLLPISPISPDANYTNFPGLFQTPAEIMLSLQDAQEKGSQNRVVKKTCLIATGILVCTIGMLFTLLSYICFFNQCQVSKSSINSTAQLGRILTISQATSHIALLSVPFIMGILSNLASARWLRSSVEGGPNCPSPMQLGLMMSMYDGAGLISLFYSIKYIFKRPKNGRKLLQPPIFRQCVFFLGSSLAITYVATAADSWLHASSTSFSFLYNSTFTEPADFGRELNTTMCSIVSASQSPGSGTVPSLSCGLGGEDTSRLGEGYRVIFNTSTLHRVVFADDQTAIVVPYSLPENISYVAQTLGVKSQCMSVTRDCVPSQPTVWDGAMYFNCSWGPLRYANGKFTASSSSSDGVGGINLNNPFGFHPLDNNTIVNASLTNSYFVDTNPFSTGDIMSTTTYVDPVNNTNRNEFINNTGWLVSRDGSAYNFVYCNVTSLSVHYRYESLRYIIDESTPQPYDISRYLVYGGIELIVTTTSVSTSAITQTGVASLSSFEENYSFELSRRMVAGSAYIYQPTAGHDVRLEKYQTRSKLQLIPLVIFVGAILIFVCQVLYISITTIVVTRRVQYVGLAARHLNSPIIAMQRLYGHPNPALTWEVDLDKGFGPETEYDRLRVGPAAFPGSDIPGSVFIVAKKLTTEKKRNEDLEPVVELEDDESSLPLEALEEENTLFPSGSSCATSRTEVKDILLAEVDGHIVDAAGLFTQEEGRIWR